MVRWEPDAKLHESGREFLFGMVLGEAARPPGAAPGAQAQLSRSEQKSFSFDLLETLSETK